MRTILPLVVVCFLSVTLVSGYRLHERLDRGPFNPLQARWELPHRRGDCKEKGEVCSSSSECCNTGCTYKDQEKPNGISAKFVPLTVERRRVSILE